MVRRLRNGQKLTCFSSIVLLLSLNIPIVPGLGESLDRGCLASGKAYLARYHELLAEASGKPAYSMSELFNASNRLNFSSYSESDDYRSDPVVRRLAQKFIGEVFHQNATAAESARVVAQVNDMYSSSIATVGLPRFFAAIRVALSNANGDASSMFQTAKAAKSTGYADWHHLGSHAMRLALRKGIPGTPAQLLEFLGSHPDWSFFVHGAGWGILMDSLERGDMYFSDDPRAKIDDYYSQGPLKLLVGDSVENMYKLCSPTQASFSTPTRSWTDECLHGFGHGAFMFAVESLATAQKPLSVVEVLRRGEAVCIAVGGGWAPAMYTLAELGIEYLTCLTGLWMVATDISTAVGVFEANPKRYAWPKNGDLKWVRLFDTVRRNFPAVCTDRKDSLTVTRVPMFHNHSQVPLRIAETSGYATFSRYLDEKDMLAGACTIQASTYNMHPIDSKVCATAARSSPMDEGRSTSLGAVSCAITTGAHFFVNSASLIDAHNHCYRIYVNKAASGAMPGRALYVGCVSGASVALVRLMRSSYGSNEADGLDSWPGDPLYSSVKRSWKDHAKQLLKSRQPREDVMVNACAHLAEDPSAFGACITGAMAIVNIDGGIDFGRCLLNLGTDAERSRRHYYEMQAALNSQKSP